MNRIDKLFDAKKTDVLTVYFTAGYPELDDTITILHHLQQNKVDMVEIGMPYSDPVADGEVLQYSSNVALRNGMSIKKLFSQLHNIRKTVHLPLILMGYMNPVMQYGIEKFCRDAKAAGVDGIILPDLPPHEYEAGYRKYFDDNGLHVIFLVTPETTDERVKYIDQLSNGFLYAVSSSSTTGMANPAMNEDYLLRLQRLDLKNPVLVGFGISDASSLRKACAYSNGAIIGSAFVKSLMNVPDTGPAIAGFLKNIR